VTAVNSPFSFTLQIKLASRLGLGQIRAHLDRASRSVSGIATGHKVL